MEGEVNPKEQETNSELKLILYFPKFQSRYLFWEREEALLLVN
jgi:hypothetical protein